MHMYLVGSTVPLNEPTIHQLALLKTALCPVPCDLCPMPTVPIPTMVANREDIRGEGEGAHNAMQKKVMEYIKFCLLSISH